MGRKILVVDDDEVIREVLGMILSKCEVLTAANGKEALEILEREKPDLVITDFVMPEMDGLELTRRIHDLDSSIPVIVVSAFVGSRVEEIKRSGARAWIEKPFKKVELLEIVKKLIKSAPAGI